LLETETAVAGGGVAGFFAAVNAAKSGCDTVLTERFGSIGGNMGAPGMMIAGDTRIRPLTEIFWDKRFYGNVNTVVEFLSRVKQRLRRSVLSYPELSQLFSRVASGMCADYGVKLLLSCGAGAPIMDGNRVMGYFVETSDGRKAVLSRCVIDTTGDASVAAAGGAPCIRRQSVDAVTSPNMHRIYMDREYKYWNDGGIYYGINGIRYDEYIAWYTDENIFLSAEEEKWKEDNLTIWMSRNWKPPIIPILRAGWESGEFTVLKTVRPKLHVHFDHWFERLGPELIGGRAQVFGEYEPHLPRDRNLAENELRNHIADGIEFFRTHIPGWKNARLLFQAPFLGSRGGRHILGKKVLSPADMYAGRKDDHTVFVCGTEIHRGGHITGFDVPYEIMLPREINGIIVAGRGASYLRRGHDPSIRARPNMMILGAAAGIAAGLSCGTGKLPGDIDTVQLQKRLHEDGFYLGEPERLQELGLLEREGSNS
jgi:hypothetical protein